MIFSRDILLGLAFALLIASAVGGFNYWQKYQEKKLDEVARIVYLYEQGQISREEVLRKVSKTPYMPYFLIISGEEPARIAEHLKGSQIEKLFLEKSAFELYRDKKGSDALRILEKIKPEDFNYPSALLLKAMVHESEGRFDTARDLYGEIYTNYRESYFGKIAYARLLSLEGQQDKDRPHQP